jgi:hypothetical protein
MTGNGACQDCLKGVPNQLEDIGVPVRHGSSLGRAVTFTEYSFGQCQACGSVWVHIKDSGADGRGKSDQRLTKGLF